MITGPSNTISDDSDSPVIYLVNPISGEGHLDAYARLYSAAFLRMGFRVVLVADDDACLEWLKRKNIQTGNFVVANSTGKTRKATENQGGFLLGKWPVYRRMAARALDKVPRFKIVLLDILNRMAKPDKGYPVEVLLQRVHLAEKISGLSPILVFILYSDILDQTSGAWANWHYPWVCIRFSPFLGRWRRNGGLEPFFETSSFCGACFLDEESTFLYRRRRPEIPFATVPDVCDSDFPTSDFSMARELRQKAAGRAVVFAGGGLTSRKGIDDLLRVISRVDPDDYFFALVGKVYWSTFSKKEAESLQKLYDAPPENVFVHRGYLKDERDFNAIMAEADIIYAVYKDFPHSSNLLSKAAHFERPLLVSNQHLMGRRVEEYGLGLTVPEGDIDGIIDKLGLLRNFNVRKGAQAYRKAHSQQALESVLGGFLEQCLQNIRQIGRSKS